MRGKMTHNINIKIDDGMKGFVGDLCILTGYSVSDLFRQALLLAGPLMLASPDFTSRITLRDIELSNVTARKE